MVPARTSRGVVFVNLLYACVSKSAVSLSPCFALQPPELLRFGRMSPAVDVYAFGVMSECSTAAVNYELMHATSSVSVFPN
jgi:hypothetical protein